MLKSMEKFWNLLLDFVAPPRKDFALVKSLDEHSVFSLPKSEKISSADWIHSLFHYKDNRVRAIIWELKYKNNTAPLDVIGRMLYEEILALISDIATFNQDAKFLLVPIPISQEKRILRGYNQSDYIAKAILEHDISHSLLYAPQWFSKIKDTEEQNKSVSKKERMKNLLGCFTADPRVEGQYVILIDDVVTTGSTLSEARKTLLEAGARNVYAFTIAH